MVITLCGSSKFRMLFEEINQDLTLQGHVVFSLGVWAHDSLFNEHLCDDYREILEAVHRKKIEMSDAIYVVNKGGYIGKSTKEEIAYAKSLHKIIWYMEPPFGCHLNPQDDSIPEEIKQSNKPEDIIRRGVKVTKIADSQINLDVTLEAYNLLLDLAIKNCESLNDFLSHALESGLQGLKSGGGSK